MCNGGGQDRWCVQNNVPPVRVPARRGAFGHVERLIVRAAVFASGVPLFVRGSLGDINAHHRAPHTQGSIEASSVILQQVPQS